MGWGVQSGRVVSCWKPTDGSRAAEPAGVPTTGTAVGVVTHVAVTLTHCVLESVRLRYGPRNLATGNQPSLIPGILLLLHVDDRYPVIWTLSKVLVPDTVTVTPTFACHMSCHTRRHVHPYITPLPWPLPSYCTPIHSDPTSTYSPHAQMRSAHVLCACLEAWATGRPGARKR